MAEIAALNFLAQKQINPGVYVTVGTDQYLQRAVNQKVTKLIDPQMAAVNVGKFDMSVASLADLLDDATSTPFFGDLRVVVGLHADFLTPAGGQVDVSDLEAYLKEPTPTTILLVQVPAEKMDGRKKITRLLKRNAVVIDCASPAERQVRTVITQKLAQTKHTIEPAALELLLTRTNVQLAAVMSELPKLSVAVPAGETITRTVVAGLVPVSFEESVFELSTLVLQRKTGAAVQLFATLLQQKEEPTKLVMLLISQFRLLLQTLILKQRGYSQGNITQTLKVHPYRIKLAQQTLRSQNLQLAGLQQALLGLIKLEYQLKTTQQDANLLFNLFMVAYANDALATHEGELG